jgi:hypothetical protein
MARTDRRSIRLLAMPALVLAALLATALPAPAQRSRPADAVAIVVHPDTRVVDVSRAQLRSIFLGEQQFWPDHLRITLLVRAPVAVERELVLDRIYRMSESEFRQYWIAKMFRAEVASGPKVVYSSDMARELVNVIKGAITFIPSRDVTPDMKVLRIDGKVPGDAGYALR